MVLRSSGAFIVFELSVAVTSISLVSTTTALIQQTIRNAVATPAITGNIERLVFGGVVSFFTFGRQLSAGLNRVSRGSVMPLHTENRVRVRFQLGARGRSICAALWKRSSGFFSIAPRIACSSPTGIDGFSSRGGFGEFLTCIIATVTGLSATNGSFSGCHLVHCHAERVE